MSGELSLHDELAKAFEDYPEDGDLSFKKEDDEIMDDKNDEKAEGIQDLEAEKKPEEESEPKNDDESEEKLTAPQHWSAEDKAAFDSSPKSVQEWALRRDGQMNSDYTKKTQEIADFRKMWQPVNDLFSPHIQRGVNPAAVISNWANIAQHLERNPAEAIKYLAGQYKIDLSSFTPKKNDDIWEDDTKKPVDDPRLSQLENQLRQLTGHLQQRDHNERETKVKSFEDKIRAFSEQKTEAGEPAHPHFDELLTDMMALARAAQSIGVQPELNDLYEKALWANPSTREKTIAAQQSAAAKKAEEEAIAKAKKAKHASKSISGNGQGASLASSLSIREMLESQF